MAALKLITSGVSFFSHALMAARKRDDVQSYTDASHFTEEMSCQLLPPALFTILIRDLKVNVLVTMRCCSRAEHDVGNLATTAEHERLSAAVRASANHDTT